MVSIGAIAALATVLSACATAARAQAWGNPGWPGAVSSPMAGIMHQQSQSGAGAWGDTLSHMRAQRDGARASWAAGAAADRAARADMNRPAPELEDPHATGAERRTEEGGPVQRGEDPYARDWSHFEREEARVRQQMQAGRSAP
ncbi:hypothetical protein [Novacetimonas pomaceti]|uniref:Lipoprotein n=1 Tax=Novacetimonas pomaceti TaxID=2021998 RepID=A0A318QE11_9PROT|nr:hypothetical protein [Novacetimonas pomaceti]MBV1834782.1 hypothetical protein [Novacetimonas pomaceti]PYD75582.1 hypothetical protein CFR71_08350 [Novacetimonas pomaceti]